jgi:large subunit ribosomal protein L3
MAKALIGEKVAMTRLYVTRRRWLDEHGQLKRFDTALGSGKLPEIKPDKTDTVIEETINVPVTVIKAGPCFVSQVKTVQTEGYDAAQLAFAPIKARNSTMPLIGHDAKAGIEPMRIHREVRLTPQEAAGLQPGQELTVEVFAGVHFVDVIGISKGKGFQGVMKRWHFKGMVNTHGTERKHRSPGSISAHATNRGFSGRPKKGLRMAGHMGVDRVTVRSLELLGTDRQNHLLLVKGPVPGPNRGVLMIREAKRLYKRKAKLVQASQVGD